MEGYGRAYGAISIVNAISIGKGAALGIKLYTEAEVKVNNQGWVRLANDDKDPTLAVEVVKALANKLGIKEVGAEVRTRSNIPEAVGLKSSSSAAVAIALAFLDAVGVNMRDEEVLKIVAEASRKSGVSITGAIDDAAACMLGGVVMTDNVRDEILKHERISEELVAVLLIPDRKIYTKDFDKRLLEPIREFVEMAFSLALRGDYWRAMTLNGIMHAAALSLETKPIMEMIRNGALAAGVSGTGPAIGGLFKKNHVEEVVKNLSSLEGKVVVVDVNNSHAVMGR